MAKAAAKKKMGIRVPAKSKATPEILATLEIVRSMNAINDIYVNAGWFRVLTGGEIALAKAEHEKAMAEAKTK